MKVPSYERGAPPWPLLLTDLCRQLQAGSTCHDTLRTRLWTLLRAGMLAALRRHNYSSSGCSAEELEDLASATALDLMSRAESGDWDFRDREPAEVLAYLRAAARHALSAAARRARRLRLIDPHADDALDAPAEAWRPDASAAPPEARVESREFAHALLECVARMRPRAQHIWLMRAVLDMDARSIARHPDIGLSEANVHVILNRARSHLRECLGGKGFSPENIPRGAFAELWAQIARRVETSGPPSAGRKVECVGGRDG